MLVTFIRTGNVATRNINIRKLFLMAGSICVFQRSGGFDDRMYFLADISCFANVHLEAEIMKLRLESWLYERCSRSHGQKPQLPLHSLHVEGSVGKISYTIDTTRPAASRLSSNVGSIFLDIRGYDIC